MSTPQTGTIRAWNDARGFGFVRPDGGGEDVFLHIKALPPQGPRPQVGARVRYERVLSADLKPRAAGARLLAGQAPHPGARHPAAAGRAPAGAARKAQPAPARTPRRDAGAPARTPARRTPARAGTGMARYACVAAFAALYAVCSTLWPMPAWIAGAYLGLSAVTYGVYAADKRAAQANAWRVSEKNLLLLGLAGGWPGAIVAQQRLRHKSSKASFQWAFWCTVALNVAGFVYLASPLGRPGTGGA